MCPNTKTEQLMAFIASGDWPKAIRLASKRPVLGSHKQAICEAAAALLSAEFYRSNGKDPDAMVGAGIAALQERYGQKAVDYKHKLESHMKEQAKNVGIKTISLDGTPIFTITRNSKTGLCGWRTYGKIELPSKRMSQEIRSGFDNAMQALTNAIYTLTRWEIIDPKETGKLTSGPYVEPVRSTGPRLVDHPDYKKAAEVASKLLATNGSAPKVKKRA